MPRKLTDEHKKKISISMKKYHQKCKLLEKKSKFMSEQIAKSKKELKK